MLTKRVNKLLVAPLIFILILTIGVTYAWFTKNVNTNNRTITISAPENYIGIYGDNKNNIELNKEYTFTVENRGNSKMGYEVYIASDTNIDLSTIAYSLSGAVIASGNLSENKLIIGTLQPEQTVTITITLSNNSGNSFLGKIKCNTIRLYNATEVEYTNSNYTSCTNVDCALKELNDILS